MKNHDSNTSLSEISIAYRGRTPINKQTPVIRVNNDDSGAYGMPPPKQL